MAPLRRAAARVRWSLSPLALKHAFKLALCVGDDAGVHKWPIKRLGIVLKGCDGISVD